MTTAAQLLLRRADDDSPAILFADRSWSFRELVDESRRRAALFRSLAGDDGPQHIGVLLDNSPEYLLWLGGAALSGTVLVGINSTYRGEQLAQLIRHTDCQVVVTSREMRPLLDGLQIGSAQHRIIEVDDDDYQGQLGDVGSSSNMTRISSRAR